jgi:hypothetical protein
MYAAANSEGGIFLSHASHVTLAEVGKRISTPCLGTRDITATSLPQLQ